MTTRITEPTTITRGERVAWTRTFDDYSAAEYNLEYRFRSSVGPGFDVDATADGADFDAVITAAVSLAAGAGVYTWQAWLTEQASATNTFIADSGEMTLKAGFVSGTVAATDTRSDAKIALDAINAAISGKATADILEYEVATPAGSRKVKRMSMTDLIAAQKHFAAIVNAENTRERMRKGGPFAQRIGLRMYEE